MSIGLDVAILVRDAPLFCLRSRLEEISGEVWILSLLETVKHVINTLHVVRVHDIGLAMDLSVLGREELDAAKLAHINLVLLGHDFAAGLVGLKHTHHANNKECGHDSESSYAGRASCGRGKHLGKKESPM